MSATGNNHSTLFGTVTGTLFSMTVAISPGDILKTALLAAIGAIASFLVSVLLKWITNVFKRN